MQKLKVLILHNYITPYRFPLFKAISDDKNIDLTVYFMSRSAKNRKWKKFPTLDFKYKILPKIEINFLGRDLFAYIFNYTFPYLFLKNKYDVVISAGWLDFASQISFLICKITGKKFIIWSESTINEPNWRRTITLPFIKYLVKNSDASIAIGTLSKEYLISLGAKPEKIFVAYSTVDVKHFIDSSKIDDKLRNREKRKLGVRSRLVVLYVGQFIERKGVIYLIDAYKELKNKINDISLLLLGYGPMEHNLKKYVKDNGIKDVYFKGHVEIDEMPKIYSIADVFVLPSLEETWGLVINEAMACGLPVIATEKVGSSHDLIINGKNGYIVPARESDSIYSSLLKILSSPSLKSKMSRSSSERILKYTPEAASNSFIKAINYVR